MMDPHQVAVLIRPRSGAPYKDRTDDVREVRPAQGGMTVTFGDVSGAKEYTYGSDRVLILQNPVPLMSGDDATVEVCGKTRSHATEVLYFEHPSGSWAHVFYTTQEGERCDIRHADDVRVLENAAARPAAAEVLSYWRDLVAHLRNLDGGINPIARAYQTMGTVHSDSALARYLEGTPIGEEQDTPFPIFPFSSNLSQRNAVLQALRYPISVIDGPPGTGKTQTILNLLATLGATSGIRVGVVSSNNAAVDNVKSKLSELGFGFILASLGRRQKRTEFFAGQEARNAEVDAFLAAGDAEGDDDEDGEDDLRVQAQLTAVGDRILGLQDDERILAQRRQDLAGHRLEFRHFTRYWEGHETADLDGVPLLNRDPDRILDYLAETQLDRTQAAAANPPIWLRRWLRRLRWLVLYGPLKGIDPNDSAVVLELQRAYYEGRIAELEREVSDLEARLSRADLSGLVARQRELSQTFLRSRLRVRYGDLSRRRYDERHYLQEFDTFSTDYPVIASTCHSLRRSIGTDRLLDWLIIDEASQVDLLAGSLALASTRRVVVVGDLAQLPHIPDKQAVEAAGLPPREAYDYEEHSLLSSLEEVYGDALPRTMLQEHYRCDPAIIGFCNEEFYDGRLIPFARGDSAGRPLILHTTVEGNHMRKHQGGGRSNQREIDVIKQEVIPRYCVGIRPEEIGVTSPYRKQIAKVNGMLVADLDTIAADTVHSFQGREKRVVIMSTVLDESREGRHGPGAVDFADNPHLVNVAVSRARERFILVTDYDKLPTSHYLRDLVGYIEYHDPESRVHQSSVVSIFDLLYRRYSERLEPLAARLRRTSRYKSENIAWTVLEDLLSEEPSYRGLEIHPQVLVRNLLADLDGLTAEEATYVRNRCSLDFVIYRPVTRLPVLAIEVNGFAFHEYMPDRVAKDKLKKSILQKAGVPLLALATTESGEVDRIREALDEALAEFPSR